jgi:hypothetical protein
MGKKDKKGAKATSSSGDGAPSNTTNGAKKENGSSVGPIVSNKTSSFAVLDVAGITQAITTSNNGADTSGTSGGGTGSGSGAQGRRATEASGPKIKQTSGQYIGGDSFTQRTKDPAFLKDRLQFYELIKERRQKELVQKIPIPISVTMPDGTILTKNNKTNEPFMSWITTPYDVAASISQGLADSVITARVTYENFVTDYNLIEDGMGGSASGVMEALADNDNDNTNEETKGDPEKTFLWDLTRPLVGNVLKLELLKFENDPEAKTVFWHSSAHMLGEALEHLYGCKLTIGPPLAGGFFYDSYMGKSDALREDDCTFYLFCLLFFLTNTKNKTHLIFSTPFVHFCFRNKTTTNNTQTKIQMIQSKMKLIRLLKKNKNLSD